MSKNFFHNCELKSLRTVQNTGYAFIFHSDKVMRDKNNCKIVNFDLGQSFKQLIDGEIYLRLK
jgi:hypothetical protein